MITIPKTIRWTLFKKNFPNVNLIALNKNTGFGFANNIGFENAKGKYILLLNPDTVLQEDTLQTMYEFMESNPEVGIAGCKVLNPDGTLQLACRRGIPTPWVAFTKLFGLQTLFPKSKLFGRYNLTFLPEDEFAYVDAISGSFMFLRREVFVQLRGFDSDFFMYGEDLDLCIRAKKNWLEGCLRSVYLYYSLQRAKCKAWRIRQHFSLL